MMSYAKSYGHCAFVGVQQGVHPLEFPKKVRFFIKKGACGNVEDEKLNFLRKKSACGNVEDEKT